MNIRIFMLIIVLLLFYAVFFRSSEDGILPQQDQSPQRPTVAFQPATETYMLDKLTPSFIVIGLGSLPLELSHPECRISY